jgi:HK97 family phage major capsid protein
MNRQDLNKRKNELLTQQDAVLNTALEAKRILTDAEEVNFKNAELEIANINQTLVRFDNISKGRSELALPTSQIVVPTEKTSKGLFSADYQKNFWNALKNRQFTNAALGEGGTTDGGYLVPITVDSTIVPLAPQESSVRKLALVIPTQNDIKLPAQLTKTLAAAKAESRSSDHPFTGTAPSFTQVTLSAFMAGALVPVTLELAQDVPALQPFLIADLSRGINNFEENAFVNGSGSGEPEGILTGADAGQTAHLSAAASLDMLGTLNANYYNNASWLMHRQTGIAFRKAQLAANQFNQYWERVGTQDYLHGFPVFYSAAMPVYAASPAVNGAIAFGDFKTAVTIGDRGGSGIAVTVDSITQLINGKINVFGYRRTDSRVRVSEAVKVWIVNG